MRTATPALVAFLSTGRTALAFDLWTLTMQNGITAQWTSADKSIVTTDGRVFASGAGVPTIERSTVTWRRGIQTDSLDVTMYGDATVMIAGRSMVQFATADGFSGATVMLERAYFDDTLVFKGSLLWFVGTVADVDPDRYKVAMTVRDDVSKLDIMMPRNLFQPGCLNTLYDVSCAVNPNLYAVNLSVSGGAGTYTFVQAVYTGKPSGWFQQGRLRFNSGANAGISRTIKGHATYADHSDFVFGRPFPFPIEAGATFTAWAGCDRTLDTCTNKFTNRLRFKGTPFIPDATTVT